MTKVGSNSSGSLFQTNLNADGVLYADSSGVINSTTVGTSTYVLTSNGAGNAPTFQAASASGAITSITGNSGGAEVPSSGNFNIVGTGSITVAGSANTETVELTGLTNHALQVGAGTATLTQLGAGTTGQVLQTNTGADPTWSTATYPSTTTINDVLYSSANNVVGQVTAANNGVFISGTTGIPSWLAAGTTGQVLTATTGSPASWASPATSGTVTTVSVVSANGFAGTVANASSTPAITLTTTITGVLSGNGTAISGSAVTQYGVVVGGATNAVATTAVGATGTVLQGNTGAAPTYSTATYPSTTTINQILYSSSNNIVGGVTAGDYGVLISGSTGIPSWLANGTTGQILTATTSGNPSWESPATSGFYAYSSGTLSDVTGDGTQYLVILNSTTLNTGAAYNTGSGVYTAPATGIYFFNFSVFYMGIGAAHTNQFGALVVNSVQAYFGQQDNPFTNSYAGQYQYSGAVGPISLNGGDTVTLQVLVYSSTKTVSLHGGIGATSFSGFQVY